MQKTICVIYREAKCAKGIFSNNTKYLDFQFDNFYPSFIQKYIILFEYGVKIIQNSRTEENEKNILLSIKGSFVLKNWGESALQTLSVHVPKKDSFRRLVFSL